MNDLTDLKRRAGITENFRPDDTERVMGTARKKLTSMVGFMRDGHLVPRVKNGDVSDIISELEESIEDITNLLNAMPDRKYKD